MKGMKGIRKIPFIPFIPVKNYLEYPARKTKLGHRHRSHRRHEFELLRGHRSFGCDGSFEHHVEISIHFLRSYADRLSIPLSNDRQADIALLFLADRAYDISFAFDFL